METPFDHSDVAWDYMLLRFAREGITPSEYKRLTVREWASLSGILPGESKGFRHKRGQLD